MTDSTPVTRLFGGPGSGKTTALLDQVEQLFEEDPSIEVDDILVVSYTRAAAAEVRERLAERLDVSPRSLQGNVCTMHAKAYNLLNLSRDRVVSDSDKKDFCEEYGLEYEDEFEGSLRRTARSTTLGNKVISTSQWLQRTRREVADWYDVPFHWDVEKVRQPPDIDPYALEGNKYTPTWSSDDDRLDVPEAIRAWRAYKGEHDLVGFADMLERVVQRSLVPMVDYLFIDEFQDITLLQFDVYQEWKPHMERVVIAGDDDQVVYAWQGADPNLLLDEQGDDVILETSYRLPSRILQTCQRSIRHIEKRQRKDLKPRTEGGVVEAHQSPSMLTLAQDVTRTVNTDDGSIMVLFRARYQMFEFIDKLIDEGIRFQALTDQRMWTPRLIAFTEAVEAIEDGEPITLYQARRLAEMLADSSFGTNDRGDLYDALDELEEAAPEGTAEAELEVDPAVVTDVAPFMPGRASAAEMVRRINSFQQRSLATYFANDQYRDLPPDRVRVGTIHSAKGREADHVYLATDLTEKVVEQMAASVEDPTAVPGVEEFTKDANPVPILTDNERRVFYVGMSRARERLVLLENLVQGAPTLPIDVILCNRQTDKTLDELLEETWVPVEAD
ncbi:MAG: UvrD-helicase domain-containing protein [Halobacteriota archaeon]